MDIRVEIEELTNRVRTADATASQMSLKLNCMGRILIWMAERELERGTLPIFAHPHVPLGGLQNGVDDTGTPLYEQPVPPEPPDKRTAAWKKWNAEYSHKAALSEAPQ